VAFPSPLSRSRDILAIAHTLILILAPTRPPGAAFTEKEATHVLTLAYVRRNRSLTQSDTHLMRSFADMFPSYQEPVRHHLPISANFLSMVAFITV
jgi:hypothetical protein